MPLSGYENSPDNYLSKKSENIPTTPHVEHHFTATKTVRDIVIGTSDGLTVPFALATGISGAGAATNIVVTAGLTEMAAGSIAIGLGGYLAARADVEHYETERQREVDETEQNPEQESVKATLNFLRRIPFTLAMLASLVFGAIVTNTYFEQITRHWINRTGFAPNDLWYWRLERMFTSALVTSGGWVFWEALFFVAFAVGLAEWMTGWRRAAATFWGVHLLALVLLSLVVSLFLHELRAFGLEAAEAARDVGPSAGYFACLGLVSAQLKRPWNLVSGAALFAMFVTALLLPPSAGESATLKFSADLAHMLAFPLGWLSARIGYKLVG